MHKIYCIIGRALTGKHTILTETSKVFDMKILDSHTNATKQQLLDNDFYVVNPQGYYELVEKTKDMDIKLVVIYISTPYRTIAERAKKCGILQIWQQRYQKEDEEFSEFEKSKNIQYRILNANPIKQSVEKLIHIMEIDKKRNKIKN